MPTKKAPAKKTTKTTAKKPVKKTAVKTAVKTVKKAAAKKAPAKKTVAKKVTRKSSGTKVPIKKPTKELIYASDQESFWTSDGEILNSLMALRDALAEMDADIYQFHAAGEQNDFSLWVDTVLRDGDCAQDLKKAKTPRSAKTTVVRHLKMYSV